MARPLRRARAPARCNEPPCRFLDGHRAAFFKRAEAVAGHCPFIAEGICTASPRSVLTGQIDLGPKQSIERMQAISARFAVSHTTVSRRVKRDDHAAAVVAGDVTRETRRCPPCLVLGQPPLVPFARQGIRATKVGCASVVC